MKIHCGTGFVGKVMYAISLLVIFSKTETDEFKEDLDLRAPCWKSKISQCRFCGKGNLLFLRTI